jgi:hypothetical protein
MGIVGKTRTRIMHQIMNSLGVQQGYDVQHMGITQHSIDTIEDVFHYSEKSGKYEISSMIVVTVTKTLIEGQGKSL